MNRLLLFIALLSAAGAGAQTYSYKPLALDTSSFWLSEFYFYDGGYVCRGEQISVVTGDTLIGGQPYARIETYTTEFPFPEVPMCNRGYLSLKVVTYVREDAAVRKVYYPNDFVAIDFNLQSGDTLIKAAPDLYSLVDSVSIVQIMGVDRRVQWGKPIGTNSHHYRTIEGVGMSYNFPVRAFGEWGIPVYRMQCYSKGGQTLYTNSSTTDCRRKPPASLGIANSPGLDRSAFSLEEGSIRVLSPDLLPLGVEVFDMAGRRLRNEVLRTSARYLLELPPGSYVLRLSNRGQAGSFRIFVP